MISCPNECSYHGRCRSNGKCDCDDGWSEVDCSLQICPTGQSSTACAGHGTCGKDFMCRCVGRWSGPACSDLSCSDKCHEHGHCINGTCVCERGYGGDNCDILTCPLGCSGKNGVCENGVCKCKLGWRGERCQTSYCPIVANKTCADRGICQTGPLGESCDCIAGWKGTACSNATCIGHDDCNNRGICQHGVCHCPPEWTGKACAQRSCPENCNFHGRCLATGECLCLPGWAGPACSKSCPAFCSNRGECDARTLTCACQDGWGSADCSTPLCVNNCSDHGYCEPPVLNTGRGKCRCDTGFEGDSCNISITTTTATTTLETTTEEETTTQAKPQKKKRTPCPLGDCSKANDFAAIKCPNACSNNGYCYGGVCICRPDHEGLDCSVPRDAAPGKVAACAVGCSSKCIDTAHDGAVHQYDDCSKRCFRDCVDNLPVDNAPTDCSENGAPCGENQESKVVAADLIRRLPDAPKIPPQKAQEQPAVMETSFLQQFQKGNPESPKHLRLPRLSKQRSFWDWGS